MSSQANGGNSGPSVPGGPRFDPVQWSPPGDWTLKSHICGGNRDLGTDREIATWTHPYYGQVKVTAHQLTPGFDRKYRVIISGGVLDANGVVRRTSERDVAYGTALAFLRAHPNPDPDLRACAIQIADAQDRFEDCKLPWEYVEYVAATAIAALSREGYSARELEQVVRAGNHMGGSPRRNLPTYTPLRDAGVVHPGMGPHQRGEARAIRDSDRVVAATLPGVHGGSE